VLEEVREALGVLRIVDLSRANRERCRPSVSFGSSICPVRTASDAADLLKFGSETSSTFMPFGSVKRRNCALSVGATMRGGSVAAAAGADAGAIDSAAKAFAAVKRTAASVRSLMDSLGEVDVRFSHAAMSGRRIAIFPAALGHFRGAA
jgi:hypothetical protein